MHSNRIKIEKRHSNLVQLATSGNHGVFERTCKVLRTSPANFLKNIISLEASLPSRFQNVRAFAALQAHTPASTQARDCPETRNRVIRFHAAASIEIFVRLVNAIAGYSVHSVHPVYSVYSEYSEYFVYSVHSVYSVYSVPCFSRALGAPKIARGKWAKNVAGLPRRNITRRAGTWPRATHTKHVFA